MQGPGQCVPVPLLTSSQAQSGALVGHPALRSTEVRGGGGGGGPCPPGKWTLIVSLMPVSPGAHHADA